MTRLNVLVIAILVQMVNKISTSGVILASYNKHLFSDKLSNTQPADRMFKLNFTVIDV